MILIIQFGLYLLLMLGIGAYAMRRTTNNEDFLIGGRTLGPVTTAISAGASDMSSWLLLGLPGAVFASGLVEGVWISLGLTLGAYANWRTLLPHDSGPLANSLMPSLCPPFCPTVLTTPQAS